MGGMGGMRMPARPLDEILNDTAEQVQISCLALLKMLKHGKAGIPLEVMGLMLGVYLDDYTVRCVDVFAMPQSGTETTIESIDEAFQMLMIEMLKQTGRLEDAVGWYHSHPGFGCFLSSTDVNTQKSYEQMAPRWVAVVVDPIQSVRGKVVIEAFRTYGNALPLGDTELRQSTSIVGRNEKPKGHSLKDLAKLHYYNLLISFRKSDLETKMLLNLHKSRWDEGFKSKDYVDFRANVNKQLNKLSDLCEKYASWIDDEVNKSIDEMKMKSVGKFNPRDHIEQTISEIATDNINQCLTNMINTIIF